MILSIYKTENELKLWKYFWGFLKGVSIGYTVPIYFQSDDYFFPHFPEKIRRASEISVLRYISK